LAIGSPQSTQISPIGELANLKIDLTQTTFFTRFAQV
jgi:hypothetical protein